MFISQFHNNDAGRVRVAGAPAGYDARILAEMAARKKGCPHIHVALDDLRAAFLIEALAFFAPEVEVLSFPAWDCLPYDRVSPHADIVAIRLATLSRLQRSFVGPCLLLTTVNAITQKLVPPEELKHAQLSLSVGDRIELETLRAFFIRSGYYNASTVREVGEFAVRGGIVDLFPAGFENPVRLDFFGDELESLRLFDPLAQTTTGTIDHLSLNPSSEVMLDERSIASFRTGYRELFGAVTKEDPLYTAISEGRTFAGLEHWLPLFYPRLTGLFEYLPDSALTFDHQAFESLTAREQQIEDFYQARYSLFEAAMRNKEQSIIPYKPVPIESLFYRTSEIDELLATRKVGEFSPFQEPEEGALDGNGQRGRDFADARAQNHETLYKTISAYIAEQQANNRRVAIACYSQGSAERVAGLLQQHGLAILKGTKTYKELQGLDIKLIAFVILGLEHGFVSPDLTLITEQDILGDRLVRKSKKRRMADAFQLELGQLNKGDFVVHVEHGIGRYEGLETIDALGAKHDCVKLIYDGGDKLFVPVESLDALSRYAGADAGAVLDKLGGVAWQARKAKVKKNLLEIADGLLAIAAERYLKKAEMIEVDDPSLQEFAARFPYHETEDQAQTIEAVRDDLASGKPMDRLVCGDVGFGKTEVALRAAFIAVAAGYQVAVVVPTTLLARQHYQNFTQRFSGFPIRIGQLSRMVSSKDSDQTKELMKKGEMDILIGTHAVLGKEVAFQNLGLMIIDEEQHFGVKQKEKLKEMRANVHVLTLTATPIPRTLQMALTGVRELSLITTPPVDRLAVRTYVLPFDPIVIREALMREHYRGGQSFYVCPRVSDLEEVQKKLKELVPELKMTMAHGRMSAGELDDIMSAFDAGKFDLLLATNIVESGLDIPNANTIILHRADMFGLSQLYQLRGRVGRSKQRGYAYFTYSAKAPLSDTAQQRLEVISTLDQLGAGFQLASHDMDIRGTGNLLGEAQSGHIREVGVELYQQMLQDAISAAKAGENE
ncbi:MAG: transcription-repair coupling factor, partial [Bdellovibrionales bacterium]